MDTLHVCYLGQLSVALVEPCCPAQCITCRPIIAIVYENLSKINFISFDLCHTRSKLAISDYYSLCYVAVQLSLVDFLYCPPPIIYASSEQ